MGNSFLPPVEQGGSHSRVSDSPSSEKRGTCDIPLTGGGMAVALLDVVLLAPMFVSEHNIAGWHARTDVLYWWHWTYKPLASTANILRIALYDPFGVDDKCVYHPHGNYPGAISTNIWRCYVLRADTDEYLVNLRTRCFEYPERSGESIRRPVSLISG